MDIEIKQKTRVLISCKVEMLCDERQYNLLSKDPSKIFVLPTGAFFPPGHQPKIEEEEVMDIDPSAFMKTIKSRT